MNILYAVLIGISTNLDNLCTAMLVGVRRHRITHKANIIISFISGMVSYIASALAAYFVPARFASQLGGIMIIGIGVWTVISAIRGKAPEDVPVTDLGLGRTVLLGLVLAVNCLPVAFGAGATGLHPALVSAFIALCSYISMLLGQYIGRRAGERLSPGFLNTISGLILIALGFFGLLN